jgi:hypothetical protein
MLYVTVHEIHRSLISSADLISDLLLRFSISSDLDEFTLQGTFMADSPTDDVYLFLFPANVDDSNGHLAVHLPPENETYYWSFDPEGLDRLPEDSLDKLVLLRIKFRAIVTAVRWRQEAYDYIADCHCAKGFDPTSQDVAIELGYPFVDLEKLNNLINAGQVCVPVLFH